MTDTHLTINIYILNKTLLHLEHPHLLGYQEWAFPENPTPK